MSRRASLFLLAFACAAQTPAPDRQLNIDSFEKVWRTVRDQHYDPKMNGVDWQAVHDELRPKIEAAKDIGEAREIMSDMLNRLELTHFGIIPSDVYREIDSPGGGPASTGMDVRALDDRIIVTTVEADSPAAKRGVHPGWEIVRIEGREMAPVVKRIREQFAKSTLLDIRLNRAVLARLQGAEGSTVKVAFRDGHDRVEELEIGRAEPRGKLVKFGNLPPQYVWVDAKKPRPDIGYVAFNIFLDAELITKGVQDAVEGCRDCRGFILDLRGNPGGIGGLAMGVAGWFVDKSGLQLGTMKTRTGTINFALFPRPEPFRGPLAILVDGCSGSTAEILAGGMKDLHRARIFGTRSAGAALPSIIDKLSNGDGFQYAIANYISQGGQPLEGIGVIPDQEVRLTRRGLLDGHDAAVDAAVDWISKQKK